MSSRWGQRKTQTRGFIFHKSGLIRQQLQQEVPNEDRVWREQTLQHGRRDVKGCCQSSTGSTRSNFNKNEITFLAPDSSPASRLNKFRLATEKREEEGEANPSRPIPTQTHLTGEKKSTQQTGERPFSGAREEWSTPAKTYAIWSPWKLNHRPRSGAKRSFEK